MTTDMERRTGPGVSSGADLPRLRAELMATLTALWYDIDHNGGTSAATFFTPDAELRFSNAVFRGTTEIAQVYANRTARGPRVSRHVVTNLQLVEIETERVRGLSVLLLFGEDGEAPRPSTLPAMVGDVLDEFELREGRWLITSRWVQNLFIGPTTQLAVPQDRDRDGDHGERTACDEH